MIVHVLIDYRQTQLFEEAASVIGEWSSATGLSVFLIEQTYERLRFERYTAETTISRNAFAGRIFGPDSEVRWAWDGDTYEIWRTSEPAEEISGKTSKATFREELYLLWGECGADGKFREQRINAETAYPVDNPTSGDRAQIRVREYRPAKPQFVGRSVEQLNKILNSPAICAHRFVGIEIPAKYSQKSQRDLE